MVINTNKSKCIHFRRGRSARSNFEFRVGTNVLETVDKYKYLGVTLHEKNDFTHNAEALAKGAGRALGGIINKIHTLKEFGFNSYEKLYTSCIIPILDYSASVWGFKQFQQIDNVQNRAMRYFLGVHSFSPVLLLTGDTGWLPSTYRRWGSMLRFWNRLIKMDNDRLTKKVFEFDYAKGINNWSFDIKEVMKKLGLLHHYEQKSLINLTQTNTLLNNNYSNIWSTRIQTVPKLRTYRLFKNELKCE